jgi:hypothetical protein
MTETEKVERDREREEFINKESIDQTLKKLKLRNGPLCGIQTGGEKRKRLNRETLWKNEQSDQ